MPGEGGLFFAATTLGSLATLGGAFWIGSKRKAWVPWGMALALALLIAKAVLHHRPDWESALFPSPT